MGFEILSYRLIFGDMIVFVNESGRGHGGPSLGYSHFHSLGRARVGPTLPIPLAITRHRTGGRIDRSDRTRPRSPPLPTDGNVLATANRAVDGKAQRDFRRRTIPPPRCHHAVTLEGSQVSDPVLVAFHRNLDQLDHRNDPEPLCKH